MARYALVIGITDYDNRNFLPDLSKPAIDAEAVAKFLESTGFENIERLPKRWIPAEQRYEVIPGKVKGDAILQALQQILLGEQTKNQEVFIYFSGHGFRLNNRIGDAEAYLATSDSQPDGKNAISLERELNPLLRRSSLGNLVVLLDCCHAGALLEGNQELDRTLLEPSLSAFKEKQDYYLIAACRSQQMAWEDEEYSLFTAALLKGLSPEQADLTTGEISGDRLFDFVSRELRGKGQEPIRMGVGRSLILVKYGAQPQVEAAKPLLDEKGELRCPYQGLLAFTKEERPFFFGRKRVVEAIKSKLDRKWGQLNEWRAENREGRKFAKEAEEDAKTWEEHDKLPDYLWRGYKLAEAEKVLREYKSTSRLLPKAEEFIEASSKQELRSYLESPKIDDLDCEALEKEAADKSFLSQEKLKNLLADEREDAQIRLAASWLLEQWGEEMPMRMAEVDGEGKIRLRVIEEKLPTTVVEDLGNGISLELVEIPGGEFWMVSPEGEEEADPDERRRHKVKVSPFLMGKYPITQAQWKAIAERTDLKVQLDLQLQPSYFQGDDRPVESVSWHDAVEFCKRLSASTGRYYRLPSEAEWEYACRAISGSPLFEGGVRGGATPFYFGETLTGKLANYNASYTYADEPKGEHREQTTPVGSFSPNAFGLYDMHGNVWEWCADHWHESYKGAPNDGSAWLSENENNYRMLRGGSWNGNPNYCRSASRDWVIPDVRNYVIGLRVVAPSRT